MTIDRLIHQNVLFSPKTDFGGFDLNLARKMMVVGDGFPVKYESFAKVRERRKFRK